VLTKPGRMKKLPFFIVIMLIYSSTVYGQKIMMLDNELKTNSKPLEAKRKGISTVGKYEFGPYKIVSGKAGWTIGTGFGLGFGLPINNESLFLGLSSSISKQKSSFVFVDNGADTILVNTSTNTKVKGTEIGSQLFSLSWTNQSDDNYIAIISLPADSTEWIMILNTTSGVSKEGLYTAEGNLTNGVINIGIREVKQWEDGKIPAFGVICGYEFYLDNNSIAAVQSSIDTTKKKFVWLHQNLDDRMKSVLAAASASLMVHTDYVAADAGSPGF
jgi:hypothetical protein